MMLVTLQQASEHLRRDTDTDDCDLILKIEAASQAVVNYLKSGADDFLDSSGEPITDSSGDILVPRPIQIAVLMMVGFLYKERDGEADLQHGYLPQSVMSLLYPYRNPAMS